LATLASSLIAAASDDVNILSLLTALTLAEFINEMVAEFGL
jgi:hypothetical protein